MAGPFLLSKDNTKLKHFNRPVIVERREVIYDATKQVLAQNETVECIPIAAGERVRRVDVEVITIDAAAGTFDVGDGATTSGYQAAVNQAVAAFTPMALRLTEATPNTVTGFSTGKTYTAADTIDIKALGANGITTALIRLVAEVELAGYAPSTF